MTVRRHAPVPEEWRSSSKFVWVPGSPKDIRMSRDYWTIIFSAYQTLQPEHPMTVRQVYYALFSQGIVKNSKKDYNQVMNALVKGRQIGIIPWNWVEDRLRRPRHVGMWDDLPSFMEAVKRSYRRDIWQTQEDYFEFWLEKDALSGIFQDILDDYGITLNVGRGYDGWSSLKNASDRYTDKEVTILYYGDFDPSGEDMVDSMRKRLAFFGCFPDIKKLAITKEDIEEFDLPPEPGKLSDSRSAGFEAKHGELIQVELDALPISELRRRIKQSIEDHLDMDAYNACRDEEEEEDERLAKIVDRMKKEDEEGEEE